MAVVSIVTAICERLLFLWEPRFKSHRQLDATLNSAPNSSRSNTDIIANSGSRSSRRALAVAVTATVQKITNPCDSKKATTRPTIALPASSQRRAYICRLAGSYRPTRRSDCSTSIRSASSGSASRSNGGHRCPSPCSSTGQRTAAFQDWPSTEPTRRVKGIWAPAPPTAASGSPRETPKRFSI